MIARCFFWAILALMGIGLLWYYNESKTSEHGVQNLQGASAELPSLSEIGERLKTVISDLRNGRLQKESLDLSHKSEFEALLAAYKKQSRVVENGLNEMINLGIGLRKDSEELDRLEQELARQVFRILGDPPIENSKERQQGQVVSF